MQDANPGWCWGFEHGGMDDDLERRAQGLATARLLIRPGWPRSPHDAVRRLTRGRSGAYIFCQSARRSPRTYPPGQPELGPADAGHVHRRRDPGRSRTYDRRSSGDPSQPPTRARPWHSSTEGEPLESTAHCSRRRPIGPGGLGDGAAGSPPLTPWRRVPRVPPARAACAWMVRPRAARTRTTGKSRMVK